jgi:hypothetical protein
MKLESDSSCLLSVLLGLLCSLRSATPPTTSAPRRQEYRGFPATISVRIRRRVCWQPVKQSSAVASLRCGTNASLGGLSGRKGW